MALNDTPHIDRAEDDTPVVPVRERILAAALNLIQEQGFHAMTQAKVCEMAGVRHSHLTYYFPTRVKLLKEVVMHGTEAVMALLDGPEHIRATSQSALRSALAALAGDRRLSRMMVAVYVVSDEEPTLKPWLDKFQNNGILRFKKALASIGIHPTQKALETFLACLIGSLHSDYAAGSERSSRRARGVIQYAFDQMVASSEGRSQAHW